MSDTTKIEWCDHSWSPWEGCTKVSPGCLNCYAEARVRELEGLATGNEEARDGGIWVEVFVPNERMGTEDLGDSVGTLRDYFPPRGEAMPRKEGE